MYKHYFAVVYITRGSYSIAPRSNTQRLVATERIPGDLAARVQRMEGAHLVYVVSFLASRDA